MLKKLLLVTCIASTCMMYSANRRRKAPDTVRKERLVDSAPVASSVTSRFMTQAGKTWMRVPEPLRCATYTLIGTAIGYGGMSAVGGGEVVLWY